MTTMQAMSRLISFLALALLTGCASQQPVSSTQATSRDEQKRLHDIYRSAFERGFREAWNGRMVVIETMGLIGKSTDPEGDWALHEGHMDGQGSGHKARVAYEREQTEKKQ
jgi:hypothetical protein